MRKPTIYEALSEKLGRPATDRECCEDVKRILGRPYQCPLCGQRIDDGKPCGCGARV